MSSVPHIKDLSGLPEIGRYYRVPTVMSKHGFRLPVIGPEHDDQEYIGIAQRHWHHDWRFIAPRIVGRIAMDISSNGEAAYFGPIVYTDQPGEKPEDRTLLCYRDMPTFPTTIGYLEDRQPIKFLKALEDAYAAHKIKPGCAVCPHRGIPLNGLPVRNGVVVCPGHGLAWGMRTGKLVRRVTGKSKTTEATRAQ